MQYIQLHLQPPRRWFAATTATYLTLLLSLQQQESRAFVRHPGLTWAGREGFRKSSPLPHAFGPGSLTAAHQGGNNSRSSRDRRRRRRRKRPTSKGTLALGGKGNVIASRRRDSRRVRSSSEDGLTVPTATTAEAARPFVGHEVPGGGARYAQEALDERWRQMIADRGGQDYLKDNRWAEIKDGTSLFGEEGGEQLVPKGDLRNEEAFDACVSFVEDREHMDSVLNSVLRISCTHCVPSYSMPWQRLKQEQSTSTGFLIDGRRILTNAHSVEYSSSIQVRKRDSETKFSAKVISVGEESDLAIITVEDDEFWEDTTPLCFGEIPELTDDVNVLGYPVGGESISITAGVVSRVEMTTYAQAGTTLLSVQIDAAINPGNSGGPVVNDAGELVGVAFQSLEGADVENIGFVVPVNVVRHFLYDVEKHGRYTGFPRLGVGLQGLESHALRSSLGIPTDVKTGVLVTDIERVVPAAKVLQPYDVIMGIDGIRVASDGSIPFRRGERVAMRYYCSQLFPGDIVDLAVWRKGASVDVKVPLSLVGDFLPQHSEGQSPSYAIVAGLVFTVLSEPYIREEMAYADKCAGMTHLMELAHNGVKQQEDDQVVLLSQIMSHQANLGFEGLEHLHVIQCNNVPVSNLKQLCRIIDSSADEQYLRFTFFPFRIILLERSEVAAATRQVLLENCIPQARSPELPACTLSAIRNDEDDEEDGAQH